MRSLRRARWPPRVARLYCAKLALIPRSLSAMPDPRPNTAVSLSGVLEAVSDSADSQFPLIVRYGCRKKLTTAATVTDNYECRL